ncbi:guanine deaminase [Spinactinospora alkalitolerans]|uniref:Guanine deaminase n=1 Tax=Spinactinospora alkalitolerans TaxID=687207 RepID=A0A852U3X0_9ACTN|nr:guanine deaminase [Spinactinospora alkalitolerans]NYE50889.1 guanine deaminase [Spinactinospora alkalitolerans]
MTGTSGDARAATTAVRGELIYFRDDPFLVGPEAAFVHEPDGLLICSDGLIHAVGPYSETRDRLPDGVEPAHYPGCLISAGFIDTHVHYVQTEIIGAFGEQLIDWLNEFTFVAEQRFDDPEYCGKVAEVFCDALLRNGTTSALTFCATYPLSVDCLFAETERRGMRMIAGKVLMDRNAPEDLLDTPQRAYERSKGLIEKWHGRGRAMYAITPRFAPTSTPEQLAAAGTLWKEHPGTYVHSHVSENTDEIAWVKELFPERKGYLDVYDHHGLLGPRAMYAHGVHLTEDEFARCHETGTALSHCPTSNLFLGSGLFSLSSAKDPGRPVYVGLGTDIGAGTSFSMLVTMNEAYKVAALGGYPVPALRAFYLATLGGARALGLDDRIGTLAPGREADFVVLDPRATPLMEFRTQRAESIEETMFVLSIMGDDRAVRATYVAGRLAHERQRGR